METLNRTELFKVFEPFIKSSEVRQYLESLDDLNLLYFSTLIEQEKRRDIKTASPLKKLYDGSQKNPPHDAIIPTAVAPKEWLKHLPHITTKQIALKKAQYEKTASQANLWIKKTQGGGGTSVLRKNYLATVKKVTAEKIKLGSKGTDLYVTLPQEFKSAYVSLAEIQILQSLLEIKEKSYAKIYFQDIVSAESQEMVRNLWKKSCTILPSQNYDSLKNEFPEFVHFGETFQSVLPTLDEDGKLSLKRLAPGGHAFFAFEALWTALENKQPKTSGPLISVIGNGEDLGSSPDPAMVGWMIENKIAITMITTDKTEVDLKGGQISLEKEGEALPHISIVERAQAKTLGQIKLFEELGLLVKNPDQVAFFNTNVALFNYEVLTAKMKTLVDKLGKDQVMALISPTLIENKKTQKENDGVTRSYQQLEGAMGSTLLNLDKAWRKHFHEPLVHFINVEREFRSQFFSPVKNAFDFFMLFHSDRFSLNPKTLRIQNHRPQSLPDVVLENESDPDYYSEVHHILRIFEGAKILELDRLAVKGKVSFKNMTLKGSVRVQNLSGQEIDLGSALKKDVLKNCSVQIGLDGGVTVSAPQSK